MVEPAWKQEERKVGKALGGERTPLSGSNSRHTSGDVIQTPYYVDAKLGGSENSTGEKFYTLKRSDLEEVEDGLHLESKELGFLTFRFKHCSDRYAVLPWTVWIDLHRERDLEMDPEAWQSDIISHQAGGSKSTRVYRYVLQQLDHVYEEWDRCLLSLWWRNPRSQSHPSAITITWESLLWLLGRLWVCPECKKWQTINSVDPEPLCPGTEGHLCSLEEAPAAEVEMETLPPLEELDYEV